MVEVTTLDPRDLPIAIAVLPGVARRAIEAHLAGVPMTLPEPRFPAYPVFVTLRERSGALRGCIGTLSPTQANALAETARSAVLAATQDPRFPKITRVELANCAIEVSVLLPLEPVQGLGQLDPYRYGVVVDDNEGRRGVLLPDLPGIETPEQQVAIARRKAGIAADALVSLSRFEVAKVSEDEATAQFLAAHPRGSDPTR